MMLRRAVAVVMALAVAAGAGVVAVGVAVVMATAAGEEDGNDDEEEEYSRRENRNELVAVAFGPEFLATCNISLCFRHRNSGSDMQRRQELTDHLSPQTCRWLLRPVGVSLNTCYKDRA